MDLTKRLPFRAIAPSSIFDGDKAQFPGLAARFAVLADEVEPTFAALDGDALDAQRRHRLVRLWLIVLAFSATVFGALEGVSGGRWAGVAVMIVGGAATIVSRIEAKTMPGVSYLAQRAKAEELRSLYFRFLAGDDNNSEPAQWANWLAARVAEVKHPEATGAES